MMEFGSYGTGKRQLNRPSDVAVDPDGDVYVCDWANHRVQVFDPDGKIVTSLSAMPRNSPNGPGWR